MQGSEFYGWVAGTAVFHGQRIRLRDAVRDLLERYEFTHFITLATNSGNLRIQRMRQLLRQWDAEMNRAVVGPKWSKRPDERLLWFAFPEKLDLNPHWHLLMQADTKSAWSSTGTVRRAERIALQAAKSWRKLQPSGNADVREVYSDGVLEYITKQTPSELHFENFVLWREFNK